MFVTVGIGVLPLLRGDARPRASTRRRSTHVGELQGLTPLPPPARLRQRHHRPHRGGGDLERRDRVQGAAQPQRRRHPALDGRASWPRCSSASASWPGRSGAVPSEAETVISQLARTTFDGRGLLYLATIGATTLILIMAANTAYAGFPRLSALQAADGFLPAAAHLSRQPARLLARDHRPRRDRHRAHRRLQRQRHPASSRSTRSASSCPSRSRRRA